MIRTLGALLLVLLSMVVGLTGAAAGNAWLLGVGLALSLTATGLLLQVLRSPAR